MRNLLIGFMLGTAVAVAAGSDFKDSLGRDSDFKDSLYRGPAPDWVKIDPILREAILRIDERCCNCECQSAPPFQPSICNENGCYSFDPTTLEMRPEDQNYSLPSEGYGK